MIWWLSATSNPTAATGISTKYGYVLSFVSGLLLMCTPASPKTRWRRLCVERVASREVINSGGGKRRGRGNFPGAGQGKGGPGGAPWFSSPPPPPPLFSLLGDNPPQHFSFAPAGP